MRKPAGLLAILARIAAFAALFAVMPPWQAAAQVNQEEIGGLGPVEFINYDGLPSRRETAAQIRAVGYTLGTAVRGGAASSGARERYFVVHLPPGGGFRLSADIFGLGSDAMVDNIRNLRLILAGYLEGAYAYSARDAALLAEYITVYNAVYRGNSEYFSARYTEAVLEQTDFLKAGLSIRYDEWPGRTLMLIPLGLASAGPLNSIDTTSITDSNVTGKLREEDDMGVALRRDMVDLKERQADEAAARAGAIREEAEEEDESLAREMARAWERYAEAAEKREEAEKEAAAASGEKKQAAEERLAQAREEEREFANTIEEIEQRQEELETRKAEAEELDAFAQSKAAEARREREGIAADQQTLIDGGRTPARPQGVLGAAIVSAAAPLGRLVKVNPADGLELMASAPNNVNARTVLENAGGVFAIVGSGRSGCRIFRFDAATLEPAAQGTDAISQNSLLWSGGGGLYAITTEGRLARFNAALTREAVSEITVHSFASVSFSGDLLLTQRADGSVVFLNSLTLQERK